MIWWITTSAATVCAGTGPSDIAERGFCGTCGASVFWRELEAGRLSVSLGCVDAPTGLTLSRHIFTAYKGDYYTITDGLPQDARE
ncbi:GFA family protein [Paracoccus xiamenensis]|uniref:GFA family protein n=1 Tax=Paracoccus xiamenensis TaxID=2714901 RepID=UPI002E280F3F|nr:GFA family protein [Paracoccus xiamenensis]